MHQEAKNIREYAALEWGKANGNVAEDITAYGKSLGQIGHRMLTDGKDLVVIDELAGRRYVQ